MSKPWSERPLWEKTWLGPHGKTYLHAGKIIGHKGCTPFEFYDAAKKLPDYEQYRYENAVRDLTVYAAREGSPPRYELHATAKKVLRIIIGPAPDDPEYAAWWRGRLVSVRRMREQGQSVEWAEEPPVPLPKTSPWKSCRKSRPASATRKRRARDGQRFGRPPPTISLGAFSDGWLRRR